jgi:site-specific recombinase XerD
VDYWRAQRQAKAGHDSPWLFLGQRAGEPISIGSAQMIYNRAVEKSGVRRKGGIHVFRHSFATHLIESGVELPAVQRLMGHASLKTTAIYLHVTPVQARGGAFASGSHRYESPRALGQREPVTLANPSPAD